MSDLANHVKTFFCNGVANTHDDALASAQAVGQILGRPVECCYNNGPNDVVFGATTALAGATLSLLAANPLPLLIMGSRSQSMIKKRITQCAVAMARKIRDYLQDHPLNKIVLVLHSQGRDIGNKALQYLRPQEKNRISVVTLGSSPIAERAAAKVVNLQQKGDLIPSFMQIRDNVTNLARLNFFSSKKQIELINGKSHSLASYLKHPHVQQHLRAEYTRCVQEQ